MLILNQVKTLQGKHGIKRYLDDSYEGPNWNSKTIQSQIEGIKDEVKQHEKEDPDHPDQTLIY